MVSTTRMGERDNGMSSLAEGGAGPLAGLRVIELAIFGVGPFAGALLGQLGADVIKVEGPPDGDPQRFIPPRLNGVGSTYINFNTNKRSIVLDLRDPADYELMLQLVERSDVIFNNFKPGAADRLGLSYDQVAARNPRIVYCETSGWGGVGPMGGLGATDPWVQVFGGWCSITGPPGGPAEFLRFLTHIDLNTSYYMVAAILTALQAREREGRSQRVSLSMLEAALAMQSSRIAEYFATAIAPTPQGSAAAVVAPSQAFRCLDAEYVAVCAETERQWDRLCGVIGRADLRESHLFKTNADRVANRDALSRELQLVLATRPSFWWEQELRKARVPCSTFWGLDLVQQHEQVRSNRYLVQVDTARSGEVMTGGAPWRFREAPVCVSRSTITGEATEEIRAAVPGWVPRNRENGNRPDHDSLPLAGLKVIEVSSGISGPYCGALLADNGAAVTKIEFGKGDHARGWGPPLRDGIGAAFVELNRNKDLVAFDRPSPAARAFVREAVETADVVIIDAVDSDGNRAPRMLRSARQGNPRLVLCSLSAYGPRGPDADIPGAELCVQARGQAWGGLGSLGEAPRRIGADQASMDAGVAAYQAILAALWRRSQTGRGDTIDVGALGALLNIKGSTFTSLSHPDEWPGLHLSIWTDAPNYGYATGDRQVFISWRRTVGGGRRIDFGSDNAAAEQALADLIAELGSVKPPGMRLAAPPWDPANPGHSNWREYWNKVINGRPWQDLADVVARHGGEVLPFMDYSLLDHDPQVGALGMFVPLRGGAPGARVVRTPWRIASSEGLHTYRMAGSPT
jgi:crotonobetainyl-CoA:carnitine CoA-transferase CaiB-like acyl-CoA transferase